MKSFKLPVNADVNQVAELKENLGISLQSQQKIILDASAVETVSTPLLKLLLIAQNDAKKNGLSFSFTKASSRFSSSIEDFGCLDYFKESLT
jgi:anti-anti-sigma regulatory factor